MMDVLKNTATSERGQGIRDFIIFNIEAHRKDIGKIVSEKFGISRVTAAKYLHGLIVEGILEATGRTKDREYKLKEIVQKDFNLPVNESLHEDIVWREKILPLMDGPRSNVLDICNHAFTEMLNNVKDHSAAENVHITVKRNAALIEMQIIDNGVGIFNKIQRECNLPDRRQALIELTKGKLTTDSKRHSGEGIFFTSRMVDTFVILSDTLRFLHTSKDNDWILESEDEDVITGTGVIFRIATNATQTLLEVFDKYRAEYDEMGFTRTHIPLKLLKYEGEQLISRSQAKRLLTRIDQFKEVLLDFTGVSMIGQAFADEVFRVFRNDHPKTKLYPINANSEVMKMIEHVLHGETQLLKMPPHA